jgi:hypothetical protein
MSRSLVLTALLVAPLAAPLVACDSQVDSDHQGTALATLAGSVSNARTQPTGDAEVVVIWENTSGSPDHIAAEAVDVDGSFPAQFKLRIFEPPAAELLNRSDDGVQFGVAYIVAGKAGTDYSSDASAEAGVMGMEINHLLVYLPAAIPAGSDLSYVLRGTHAAGR